MAAKLARPPAIWPVSRSSHLSVYSSLSGTSIAPPPHPSQPLTCPTSLIVYLQHSETLHTESCYSWVILCPVLQPGPYITLHFLHSSSLPSLYPLYPTSPSPPFPKSFYPAHPPPHIPCLPTFYNTSPPLLTL